MGTTLEQLTQLCREWGGDIVQVSEEDFRDIYQGTVQFFEAPFSSHMLGIDWVEKKIIWAGEVSCAELIHEMGHLFTCTQSPPKSEDYGFFGWEYLLAKHFGILGSWVQSNRNYCVEYEDLKFADFGGLTEEQKEKVLTERVAFGQKLGIIDKSLAPLKKSR